MNTGRTAAPRCRLPTTHLACVIAISPLLRTAVALDGCALLLASVLLSTLHERYGCCWRAPPRHGTDKHPRPCRYRRYYRLFRKVAYMPANRTGWAWDVIACRGITRLLFFFGRYHSPNAPSWPTSAPIPMLLTRLRGRLAACSRLPPPRSAPYLTTTFQRASACASRSLSSARRRVPCCSGLSRLFTLPAARCSDALYKTLPTTLIWTGVYLRQPDKQQVHLEHDNLGENSARENARCWAARQRRWTWNLCLPPLAGRAAAPAAHLGRGLFGVRRA